MFNSFFFLVAFFVLCTLLALLLLFAFYIGGAITEWYEIACESPQLNETLLHEVLKYEFLQVGYYKKKKNCPILI